MKWLDNLKEKAKKTHARTMVNMTVNGSVDCRTRGSTAAESAEAIEDLKKVCCDYPDFADPAIDEIVTIALEEHKENIAVFTSAGRSLLDILKKKIQPETKEKTYAALEKMMASTESLSSAKDLVLQDILFFIIDKENKGLACDREFRVLEGLPTESVVKEIGRLANSSRGNGLEVRALKALNALSVNTEIQPAIVKAVAEMVENVPEAQKSHHAMSKKKYAEGILLTIGSDEAMELLARWSYPNSYPQNYYDWGDDSLRTVDRTVELYTALIDRANEDRTLGMCIPVGDGTKGLMKAVIPAVDQLLTPVFLANRGKEYQEQAEISLGKLNDSLLWGHCGGRRDHGDMRVRFNKAMEGVAVVELAQEVIQQHTQTVVVLHEQRL